MRKTMPYLVVAVCGRTFNEENLYPPLVNNVPLNFNGYVKLFDNPDMIKTLSSLSLFDFKKDTSVPFSLINDSFEHFMSLTCNYN